MAENNIKEAFKNAYNNFDSRPLVGETLRRFYIDDFTKDAVNSIKNTIEMSEKYRKMLVIGHRGCGKSTILNKVAEDLQDKFYVVSFSALDTLNMYDVETIDILICIYLQILASMNENNIQSLLSKFNEVMNSVKEKLKITELGVSLLKTLTFKIQVEKESRKILRQEFKSKIETLNNNISDCIENIKKHYEQENKQLQDVLIIIDDLDKLETKFAEKSFFEDSHLLTMPKVKIVYSFPLETYYSSTFNSFQDRYKCEYISLVIIDQEKNSDGIKHLEKLVLKRIDKRYIADDALQEIIISSGGLLRDLIRFMQNACEEANLNNSSIIDKNIAKDIISDTVNDYYRLFDGTKYLSDIQKIIEQLDKSEIDDDKLIYLLKKLFVLEYRLKRNLWYDAHPCLKKALNIYYKE